MTQKQLVLAYVREFGSIIPAKMVGQVYQGKMFGSELPRRCRELRDDDKLHSEPSGKFERFYLPDGERKSMAINTNSDAYKKFQAMGDYLKNGGKKPPAHDYTKDTYEELKTKKEVAEKWLKENETHPNYDEALQRYAKICDEISLLEFKGL